MLENPFPVPICLLFLLLLTKTRKDFLRTSKPNVAMQHSWEYVLEAHILNTKLTTDLENDRKLLEPEEKRVSEQGKKINHYAFLLMLLSKRIEQDVRPRETGPIRPEQSLETLVLTYESCDALTAKAQPALAAASSPITVLLDQLIWS